MAWHMSRNTMGIYLLCLWPAKRKVLCICFRCHCLLFVRYKRVHVLYISVYIWSLYGQVNNVFSPLARLLSRPGTLAKWAGHTC